MIFTTIVPNYEIRTLNIYCKKGKEMLNDRILPYIWKCWNCGTRFYDITRCPDCQPKYVSKMLKVMSVENSCIKQFLFIILMLKSE